MEKLLAFLLSALMLLSFVGCGAPKKDYAALTESIVTETTDITEITEDNKIKLDIFPLEFSFMTGIGGWATILEISEDLTFSGTFHDSNLGECDEVNYPNGTVYVSNFEGTFEVAEQINEYTYKVNFKNLTLDKETNLEWVVDGIRYVSSEAYGLGGNDYTLYMPNTPVSVLPEDIIYWAIGRLDGKEFLGCYCIYNESEYTAFFTY